MMDSFRGRNLASFDWYPFLKRWSEQWVDTPDGRTPLDPDSSKTRWLGRQPASADAITQLENRLRLPLPPSYRAFFEVTDGFEPLTHAINRLLPAGEVDRFVVKEPKWVEIWAGPRSRPETTPPEIYFAYDVESRQYFRPEHLRECVQISAVGDAAVCLLNPQVVWPDGEWEAWFLASWIPGVARYRDFVELMHCEYRSFAGIMLDEQTQPAGTADQLPTIYQGTPGTIERRVEPLPRRPKLAEVLDQLASNDHRVRAEAADLLGRRHDTRAFDALVSAMRSDPHRGVRKWAAAALGRLGDPRATDPLLQAIDDGQIAVAAINALADVWDPIAVEPLLRIVERADFLRCAAAAFSLARFKEHRAIQPLVRLLHSTDATEAHNANIAAALLCRFGEMGEHAIVPALASADEVIRKRALHGLSQLRYPSTVERIKQLLDHPSEVIRACAADVLEFVRLPLS